MSDRCRLRILEEVTAPAGEIIVGAYDDNKILVLNAATLAIESENAYTQPFRVAADAIAFFIDDRNYNRMRVDRATMGVDATVNDYRTYTGMTYGGGYLWGSGYNPSFDYAVSKIDPTTLAASDTFLDASLNSPGLSYADGSIWARSGTAIRRFSPAGVLEASYDISAVIPSPDVNQFAVTDDGLYAACYKGGQIYVIELATITLSKQFTRASLGGTGGMQFFGADLFTLCNNTGDLIVWRGWASSEGTPETASLSGINGTYCGMFARATA